MEKPRAPKGRWYMAGASSSESFSMQLLAAKIRSCCLRRESPPQCFGRDRVRSARPGVETKCCVRFMIYDDLPHSLTTSIHVLFAPKPASKRLDFGIVSPGPTAAASRCCRGDTGSGGRCGEGFLEPVFFGFRAARPETLNLKGSTRSLFPE